MRKIDFLWDSVVWKFDTFCGGNPTAYSDYVAYEHVPLASFRTSKNKTIRNSSPSLPVFYLLIYIVRLWKVISRVHWYIRYKHIIIKNKMKIKVLRPLHIAIYSTAWGFIKWQCKLSQHFNSVCKSYTSLAVASFSIKNILFLALKKRDNSWKVVIITTQIESTTAICTVKIKLLKSTGKLRKNVLGKNQFMLHKYSKLL